MEACKQMQFFTATKHIFKDFQPILDRFRSNKVYYPSPAIIDLLCEFGVIWIKSDGAFLITNKHIHEYNIR